MSCAGRSTQSGAEHSLPNLPKSLRPPVKKATIARDWRGVRYEVRVENRRNDGAVRLEVVSGKATVDGTLVRAARGERKVVLRAVVG